ncbi:YceD family protein [Geomesophilobacter sediminis]|uniref:DUF177 domain-containing protein n=1 Tax=Geomesophilobacter sediminis TaxID=2798584 RepID=A0A8J7M2N8_9BACT|nr:DUF177 domain-containing protein [Geomesophilobacter sediminis]MBJ6727620.1 DUF177 domain-containing protein [Geomesophilobacter sediminis]
MKIRVEDAKKKTLQLAESEPASHYPALVELEDAGEARFIAPVNVAVQAYWEYDHLRAEGKVETRVALSCSRCLADFERDLSSEFTIFYTPGGTMSGDEEVELSEEELISVPFTGDEVDMANEIFEQVMMEIPYKPLCTDDCKGLCPNCGADLNQGECGCDRRGVNLKMSALKDLKIDK